MNLSAIEIAIYDRLGLGTNPDSQIQRMIRRAINDTHKAVCGKPWCSVLRRQLLTATTVANDPFVVLPQAIARFDMVMDRTNNILLEPITLQQIRYNDPGLQSSGNPYAYAPYMFSSPVALE